MNDVAIECGEPSPAPSGMTDNSPECAQPPTKGKDDEEREHARIDWMARPTSEITLETTAVQRKTDILIKENVALKEDVRKLYEGYFDSKGGQSHVNGYKAVVTLPAAGAEIKRQINTLFERLDSLRTQLSTEVELLTTDLAERSNAPRIMAEALNNALKGVPGYQAFPTDPAALWKELNTGHM